MLSTTEQHFSCRTGRSDVRCLDLRPYDVSDNWNVEPRKQGTRLMPDASAFSYPGNSLRQDNKPYLPSEKKMLGLQGQSSHNSLISWSLFDKLPQLVLASNL